MSAKPKTKALPVPAAVKKALAGNATAKAVIEKMSPSHRDEYAKWILEAKKKETTRRRIEQLISKLQAKA